MSYTWYRARHGERMTGASLESETTTHPLSLVHSLNIRPNFLFHVSRDRFSSRHDLSMNKFGKQQLHTTIFARGRQLDAMKTKSNGSL
jgi:hypothetical protein